jgi:hypothetical protein
MVQTTGSASVHAVAVATGLATYGGSAVAAAVVQPITAELPSAPIQRRMGGWYQVEPNATWQAAFRSSASDALLGDWPSMVPALQSALI